MSLYHTIMMGDAMPGNLLKFSTYKNVALLRSALITCGKYALLISKEKTNKSNTTMPLTGFSSQ